MKVCDSKIIDFARFWLYLSSLQYHMHLVLWSFSYKGNEYLGDFLM